MVQSDLLDNLMSSDPNGTATNGCVLLLRAEMKSEFRSVRSEMGRIREDVGQLKEDVGLLKRSVDMIAVQVAQILAKVS